MKAHLSESFEYSAANGFYQFRNEACEVTAAVVRRAGLVVPEHQHAEAQLSVVLTGAGVTFVSRDRVSRPKTAPVAPGSAVYIPPGEMHRTLWQGSAEMLNVYWTEEYIKEIADQSGCRVPGGVPSYRIEPGVTSMAEVMMEEFVWTGELAALFVDQARALMARRVLRLFDRQSLRSATGLLSEKRVQIAADAIRSAPERSFTLMELARLCNSSVFHFSRSFTARLGSAPFAFQRSLRIQKARDLLGSGDLSIETVAYAVGFTNPSSFSRVFRHITGLSPTNYRRLRSGRPYR